MIRRILLPSILCTLAMFLWTFIAHMLLPLGEAGVKQIENEQSLLTAMQSTLSAPGLYMFPNMPPGGDQAEYYKKVNSGPSGLLVYHPKRQFSFGQSLIFEFVSQFIQCLIAVFLLYMTRLDTFINRLVFYAFLGLIATVATNLSYLNWYGFPTTYTLAYMFTGWVSYVCAGLVAAAMKLPRTPPRLAP